MTNLQIKLPEQKDFLLTTAPTDGAAINFTLGTNILSHIEITNNGRDYIFGATVSVNFIDKMEHYKVDGIDLSKNSIEQALVVEDRNLNFFVRNYPSYSYHNW